MTLSLKNTSEGCMGNGYLNYPKLDF